MRTPAHFRCTQCSIMLHLIDICLLTCICLLQISHIQTCLRVVVGPGLVSTSPAFIKSIGSHPAYRAGTGRYNFHRVCQTAVTAPPHVGCVVWSQFDMVCPVVQSLHELSPFVSPMCVCSGDIVVHLLQSGRGGISGSDVVSCSHPFQHFRWNRLCINTVFLGGICRDGAFRMMVRKILFLFDSLLESVFCSVYPLSPYDIGPSLLSLS